MAKKSMKKKFSSYKADANPFNFKVNKAKHVVVNQNMRGTTGTPAASRAASYAKRKSLWNKMKVTSYKSNKYTDKRILDASMTMEDRVTSRLILERKRKMKKNIFNLNDEENLTHKGQPLEIIKDFDGKASDSEDEEQLDEAFVTRAHFGGFESESQPVGAKTHKEIIDDLILDSKKKKHELQMEKEINLELTEKLDREWKDLHSLMSSMRSEKKTDVSEKKDPYDIITQQLRFGLRATPAARMKAPEEIAREEEEKRRKLEEERLSRMGDVVLESKDRKIKDHLSADGIFDDFEWSPILGEETPTGDDIPHNESDECPDEEFNSDDETSDEQGEDEVDKPNKSDEVDLKISPNDVSGNDISIPTDLNDLCGQCSGNITDFVDNVLKKYIKSKSEKVLESLENLFEILLQYSMQVDPYTNLLPHLYSIADVSSLATAEKLLEVLDKEQLAFQESKGKKLKDFPQQQTLLILKYISVLYSTSDYRHPVVTPAVIFMCDILSSPFCISLQNIVNRLFISDIFLNCVSLSKRFVPEALVFLNKVLNLAVSEEKKLSKFNLILDKQITNFKTEELDILQLKDLKLTDTTKLSIISECVKQLRRFAELYSELPSYLETFSNIYSTCSKLPIEFYSCNLTESIQSLIVEVCKSPNLLKPLIFQNNKPKPLKLFEPKFQSRFTKKDKEAKQRKLASDVAKKIKKEERGMLREMRRDAQMIATERLKEKMEADEERKRKVKQIYHDLAVQESEFKKAKKKK